MANYWLFKSEAETWSWDQQVARGAKGESWNGVRNYQSRNHMRAMKKGDLGFFYHSGDIRSVVGTVRVLNEVHADPDDDSGTWDCVDVVALKPLPKPVTLTEIKATPKLAEMVLVKNSRLSVQPVTPDEWKLICGMGGLDPAKL
jgi:predicted RNA-binding protein with PUA-like domain